MYLQYYKMQEALVSINATTSLCEVLERSKKSLKQLFDCSFAEIYLLDDNNCLVRYKFENISFFKEKIETNNSIHKKNDTVDSILTNEFVDFILE